MPNAAENLWSILLFANETNFHSAYLAETTISSKSQWFNARFRFRRRRKNDPKGRS
jgi:hypothetical protein